MHCHREMVAVRVFDCPEKDCLFSGRSAAELRVHQTTHSSEKTFCCKMSNCNYKTKTNALLNRWAQRVYKFWMTRLKSQFFYYLFWCVGILERSIKIQPPLVINVHIVNLVRRYQAIWNDTNASTLDQSHINVLIVAMFQIIR